MLNINKLKDTWYFKEVNLEKWEVLFVEGDIDNNIYIVEIWELSVEKFTTKKKVETKILWFLWQDEVFWEAALNSDLPKSVNIIARKKTTLLYINAQKLVNIFAVKYKEEAFSLLRYIIYLSNKRLSDSNSLITSTYKITQEISKLEVINNKSIFFIIEKMKETLNVDDILYYEINPVMIDYITLKYDTRIPWKLLNTITEVADNNLDLLKYKSEWFYVFKQVLSIWNNNIWYIIFLKKDFKFSDSDKKVFSTTSSSISWLIKQKQYLDEEKNKEFMEEE
jgi:CRP-like cAMP-binding protein